MWVYGTHNECVWGRGAVMKDNLDVCAAIMGESQSGRAFADFINGDNKLFTYEFDKISN